MKIVIHGNCQRTGVEQVLNDMLGHTGASIQAFSSTDLAGAKLGDDKMDTILSKADVIVFQPLKPKHAFNVEKMRSYPGQSIAFPYFFNSGYASLSYAPAALNNSYGRLDCEDLLLKVFKGRSLDEVLDLYKRGEIDFNLRERFDTCLNEMRKREQDCEVRLSDFIERNYQKTMTFISLNHPTYPVFAEIGRQICKTLGMDIEPPKKWLNAYAYSGTIAPISPYDVDVHGYEFGYHLNWFERGSKLITMLYNAKVRQQKQLPLEAPSPLLLPDSLVRDLYEKHAGNNGKVSITTDSCEAAAVISILDHVSGDDAEYDPELIDFLQNIELDDPSFNSKLGSYYLKTGNVAAAETMTRRAMTMAPDNAKLYFQLAQICMRLGKKEEALDAATKASELKPKDSWFRCYKGIVLLNLDRLEEAERTQLEAQSINDQMAAPYMQLSMIYGRMKRFELALEKIRKAVEMKPEVPRFHKQLGTCLEQLGDKAGAKAAFRKAQELS